MSGSETQVAPQRPWYRRTWKRVLLVLVLAAATGAGAGIVSGSAGIGENASSPGVTRRDLSGTGQAVTEYPVAARGEPVRLTGTGLSGEPLAVADLRGDVVVLNVWASWCAPCRAEAPILAEASRAYADKVSFLGINVRDNEGAALAFEKRYRIPYPSIADLDGSALLSLNHRVPASAVPVTVVLDRQGRIAARVLGELSRATLSALLDSAVAEQATEPDVVPSSPPRRDASGSHGNQRSTSTTNRG